MTYRLKNLSAVVLTLCAGFQAQAQGLQLLPSAAIATSSQAQSQADFIVAIVNSEPITNTEVRREAQRVLQQFAQQRRPQPDGKTLTASVLESLIGIRVQLQLARDSGIRVEEAAIDQAEQSIASQNQVDAAELRRRVARDGMSVAQFRSQLRDQILLQRLRERDVEAKVRVSDPDVDQYLREQQTSPDITTLQINLAQVLIAVPETATAVQQDALKMRAQRALDRVRAGEDFTALVREFSDVTDPGVGGQLGLRTADRYPPLFLDAVLPLSVGEVAPLVRSPAGFHILKMVEKINPAMPTTAVIQSHARHILLVPGANRSETAAREQLGDFKKRVLTGQADFAALARDNSQDGSAAQGGDLGWASPGMFVPEFEDAMNRLAPGDVSDPLVSRFGVHLIQLLERRKASLSQAEQRESTRAMLREKKFEEAYKTWLQDLRGRAYIEMREPAL
jgi:peptidyl-prolyl cis-trans isomerase SurA